MSQFEQLDIPLWDTLRGASLDPATADVPQLMDVLTQALPALEADTVAQLQLAAEAIAQIVQVFYERAALAFAELEATASQDGPIMSTDAFAGYVRQTMELDFEQFIEPLPTLPRKVPEPATQTSDGNSVVGELDQQALLAALDEQMQQQPGLTEVEAFNQALAIAHDEDVSHWVSIIQQWLQAQESNRLPLLHLNQQLQMPLVQLWLALLLGGYQLEQQGDFYEGTIWVRLPRHTPP